MTAEEAEPLLASRASRGFMQQYAKSDQSVHELAADAIALAEHRGINALLRALGAEVTDTGMVSVHADLDRIELMRRIDKELGR